MICRETESFVGDLDLHFVGKTDGFQKLMEWPGGAGHRAEQRRRCNRTLRVHLVPKIDLCVPMVKIKWEKCAAEKAGNFKICFYAL